MDDDYQLIFNFERKIEDDNVLKKKGKPSFSEVISFKDMRRAIVAWLLPEEPSGMGSMVPTRISRFQADVAAFWSKSIRQQGRKILYPVKTVIVEIRHDREQCWPDCAAKNELLPMLRAEKEKRDKLETVVREKEPELKLDDNLFPEYESWNYAHSNNKEYHKCRDRINEIELALYNGSRFDKIRQAQLADHLFLAVPAGSVHPHELADGWGLLYISDNFEVELIKEPDDWNCPMENKLHLVQNISAACLKNLLFTNGINVDKKGNSNFVRLPRRRRK